MRLLLIGIQGAGKSTQGNLLSETLNLPYLSTGHIFRKLAQEKTPIGRYIKEIMTAGFLIPDKKTITIVKNYLRREEYKNGYILDGFPRTCEQAKSFEQDIDKVIYLKVSDEEALKRLAFRNGNGDGEQREDDTPLAIKKRIELYHEVTDPVIGFYREKGLLIEVDGEKSVEEINKEILEKIK